MPQRRFAAIAAAFALAFPAAVAAPVLADDDAPASDLAAYRVQIDKKVKDSSDYLPGASLEIRDADGVKVASFVTTDGPAYVELAEGDYTLVETEAPEGYDVAEPVAFTVAAPEVYPDETIGQEYAGRTNRDRSYSWNYTIVDGLGDGEDEIVYCLNSTKKAPAGGITTYIKNDGTAAALAKATAPNTRPGYEAPNSAELRTAIMKALYVGFPNDAQGIQDELGLTDSEFRRVTQFAVWSLTNEKDYSARFSTSATREAYQRLVAGDVELPATLEAHIYVVRDDLADRYQSLIGTRFGEIQPPIVVTMEDAKATVTRGEDLPEPTPTPSATPSEEPTVPTFVETTPAQEETPAPTPTPTEEETTPAPVARGEEIPSPTPEVTVPASTPEVTAPAPSATPTVALPNTGSSMPLQNTGAALGLSVFMMFVLVAGGTSAYALARRHG